MGIRFFVHSFLARCRDYIAFASKVCFQQQATLIFDVRGSNQNLPLVGLGCLTSLSGDPAT